MLYGSSEALERITPNWDKRDYRLDERGQFSTQPASLAAVYWFAPRSEEDDAPRIEPVTSQQAFVALVANTYGNRLLDSGMRQNEFQVLGRLVESVPVKRLVPHASPDRLKDLCDLLVGTGDEAAFRC
jgi:hypothetical protein